MSKEDKQKLTKMGFKPKDIHSKSWTTKVDWKERLKSIMERDKQELKEAWRAMGFASTSNKSNKSDLIPINYEI